MFGLQGEDECGTDAVKQEFSIEIPDKEADAIHSGMLMVRKWWD